MTAFKKGDKVMIVRKTPNNSKGWYNGWTYEMEKSILNGKVYSIKSVNAYGVELNTSERGIAGMGFDPKSLQLHTPKPEKANVKIDAKISAASTKDTNPKDAIGDKKVPMWLLSPIAKAQWAVAQFVGMTKYGAWNWRAAGVRCSVYLSAMQRHIDAYLSGEEVDPIDQTPHLGHIMACAAILIDAKAAGKLTDDRPPVVNLRAAFAETEAQMEIARQNYGHMNPKNYTIADTEKPQPVKDYEQGVAKHWKASVHPDHVHFTGLDAVERYSPEQIRNMMVQGRDRY